MTPNSKPPPVSRFKLANGLTVLHEPNTTSRAFCVGVWTKTGARDERSRESGLCHFLEHMLFKGTANRSAFEISQHIEKVGGALDAFTTKETMGVYAQVLDTHRRLAIDLVGDMVSNPTFPEDQVALEREVVLEEIGDVNDAPDDLIHELFAAEVFPGHPLGKAVLGTPETVAGFTRSDLLRFARGTFRADNLVLAVYGNIDRRDLRRWCNRAFDLPSGATRRNGTRLRRFTPLRRLVRRRLHQQHICLGGRTFSYHDDRRFPLMVLTTLLGGSMSSRLFQRIRERMGLTYSIFSYNDHSRDTGLMATYMAVRPKNVRRALEGVFAEFSAIGAGGVTAAELDDTKEHLKGRILLGLETSTARLMRMVRNEMNYGRQVSERELIRRIDQVSLDDIHELAEDLLDADRLSIVSLGPSAVGMPRRSAS